VLSNLLSSFEPNPDFAQDYEEALKQIRKFEIPYPADCPPTPGSFLAEKYPLNGNTENPAIHGT
jgi:hypothetical protein